MCVIVAKKIRLQNSDITNWFLYKVRDRVYVPTYSIRFLKKHGVESIYLIDQINDWTEGVNSSGIMIVNTALQNHADEIQGDQGDPLNPRHKNRDGIIVRQCLKMKKIEEVVQTIKDELLLGNTFVSDGYRLFVIEIAIKEEAVTRATDAIKNIDDIKYAADVQNLIMKGINPEDYLVKSTEIKDKKIDLVVRTNHGILVPEAGYQKNDTDPVGYKSSVARYKHAYEAIKDMDQDTHPFEVLTVIKNLGQDDVDENPKNRPIRNKGRSKYFSGCVVMLTPTGTLYVVPIHCTFATTDFKHINDNHDVSVIILPRDLPLFESIGRPKLGDYVKMSQYEKLLW